ncbi:MAG: FtsX-like permease family protein [Anaerolineaceae bacterium]|nr:FtsX-like permease family protein [Anaerolineaceae bacterium]
MSVLWKKIWYDLWQHKSRTLLAIFSIAAGVFAVGAIFGMVDQMLSGMDAAHRAVNPSHVNIFLRNYVDQTVVDELKNIPGVLDVDPVNQITVRFKTQPDDRWELGTLVQRDYTQQIYDQILLTEGEWGKDSEIGIERLTSEHWQVGIGDSILLDVGGEEKSIKINGKVRHPFVQPPLFGGQAHFFTDAAGLSEFGIPEGYYGQLLVRVDEYSLERSKEIAADIRSNLSKRGIGVIITLYQEPDRHWGRMFVEGINAVMQVMAVVALFLSVILVLNTMTALITQQTDQIGIIKSIGGSKWDILKVYFTEVLTLGVLALIIALPAGALFAFWMSQWFLNLFNIDYNTFVLSPTAAWLQVGAAILAPIIASLQPILRGARMTVREAIATYGIGADFGSGPIEKAIERFAAMFFSTLFAISLGNMFRRKGRLILTLSVLVAAGVMFLVVMSLISSTQLTLDNELARRAFTVRIGLTGSHSANEVIPLVSNESEVSDVELWYSRNATLLRRGERLEDSAGLGTQLIGIPGASKMYRPVIIEGRWLGPQDTGKVIVLSQETANKNNLQVGDIVTLDLGDLGQSDWTILGTYRVVYGGGFFVEPVYTPLAALETVTGRKGEGTQIVVRADNITTMNAATDLSDRLNDRLEGQNIGIDFYTSLVPLKERDYVNNQFASVISTLLGLAMIAATVGAIGLTGALAIGVVERTREIGVMRSIGAQSKTISSLFLMEGALQGLIGWLIAVPIAYILSQPLARLLGQRMLELDLDYAFNFPAVFIWLVVIILFSILASIYPAQIAARARVRENLSYS